MSLIDGIIQPQAFEQIRDKIAQILLEEFQNQYTLTGDPELDLKKVYVERFVPFDYTELPCLNVGLERGDYQNQHQGYADADYRFFVEVLMKAHTSSTYRGDTKARMKVHKVLGVARAIIENPVYKTLGFAPGVIRHREIESFVFAEPTKMDQEDCTMSRIALVVKCIETTSLLDVGLIHQNYTTVKLGETDKGYYWELV